MSDKRFNETLILGSNPDTKPPVKEGERPDAEKTLYRNRLAPEKLEELRNAQVALDQHTEAQIRKDRKQIEAWRNEILKQPEGSEIDVRGLTPDEARKLREGFKTPIQAPPSKPAKQTGVLAWVKGWFGKK